MKLTRTRASVSPVHMAISSRVAMSGYRFLAKVDSSSCNCWEVKCVLCRLCLLFLVPSLSLASFILTTPEVTSDDRISCLTSTGVRTPE